ncbi:Apoptosis-resistant E3 ubiquitin protein ligase 1 [Lamellibrachia satsuma]|nr:Apoptosis-resistant E3 ubiquitin protein ligase 1 [Lamellibrachia satsuma]
MRWFVISSVLLSYGVWRLFRAGDSADTSVGDSDEIPAFCSCQLWLRRIGMEQYTSALTSAGIDSAPGIASLAVGLPPKLESLPGDVKSALKVAAQEYRDSAILYQWFVEHGLQKYFKWFCQRHHVSSLEDLVKVSTEEFPKNTKWDSQLHNYLHIDMFLWNLHGNEEVVADLKDPLWEKFIETTRGQKTLVQRNWLSLLLVACAAMFVFLLKMNYASFVRQCPVTSKHSILELFTGKYLALQYSKVFWDWDEPQVVGNIMTFRIKFFQRNGRAYAISKRDNVLIEITHEATQIPPVIELGGSQQSESNVVAVVFTVHRCGDYRIAIMIGGNHIQGSPFIKKFCPGPIDVGQTVFVNHTSTVMCMEGVNHQFLVEPRDRYGNLCVCSPQTINNTSFRIILTETCNKKQLSPQLHVVYDKPTRGVGLNVRIDQGGCYDALTTYSDEKLKNGEFTILVLTKQEMATVNNAVAKKSHNLYYEARLLSSDAQQKAKKVFCYISPKQLTIKEFYLRIFPKRLFTFRVCPSTKFQFLGHSNQYHAPVVVIDDGCQAPVVLATKDRNIIAACFTNFLLNNIGGSETFKDKQEFFYHKIRQLHSKRCHDRLVIKVSRWNLLETSMKATKHFSTSEWCKNFEIIFQGEEGLDWGGVRREWFEVVCLQLFDGNKSRLFTRFKDDPQALVHPNPHRPGEQKLKRYEFAGKIIGKCLYESSQGRGYQQMVKARFTRSFLAQLIGLRVNYKYFEQDDPELYTSKIKYIEENDVDDMELSYVEEEFKDGKLEKVHELIPNGARVPVTNQNKFEYLDALAQFRLMSRVREEIDSFLRGLNLLIPDTLLSIFDENELELLMCGTGDYSISDLMKHHTVSGVTPRFHKVLEWFWMIISGFTHEEMARLLQFTTGCSQLPPGGFCELCPKFQITALSEFERLPSAHTCFNQLCLPDYKSMESMHKAMLLAINEGNQGFGFI